MVTGLARKVQAADVFVVGPVSEPASHLHQRIECACVSQDVGNAQALERKATRKCEPTDRNDMKAIILVPAVIQYPAFHVDDSNLHPRSPFIELGEKGQKVDAERQILRFETCSKKRDFGVRKSPPTNAPIDGNGVLQGLQVLVDEPGNSILNIVEATDINHHRAVLLPLAT